MAPTAPAAVTPVYLRLSVTDRCNLRCAYCRPVETRRDKALAAYATAAELVELVGRVHRVRPLGKLRLTGGEPLVRPDLMAVLQRLRAVAPEAVLALTTNGSLLPQWAGPLREAGLDALNVSLDTLDARTFTQLTRGGRLGATLAGIEAAQAAGFSRIKVNCVLIRRVNGKRLCQMVRWAVGHGLDIRFIELMPCGPGAQLFESDYLAADEAIERLGRQFDYLGPAVPEGTARIHRFVVEGREVAVGMIAPVSHPFCAGCNRLRLDAHGRLMACLRRQNSTALLEPLRSGDDETLAQRIASCLAAKGLPGDAWPDRQMVMIGG